MKRILIICTGNTCRSPMAQALLKRLLEDAGVSGVEVISRGFCAAQGQPASQGAALAMRSRGLDISAHRAARLTADDAASADIVLLMDEGRRAQFVQLFGGGERAFVIAPGGVSDPFGGGAEVYEQCAAQLERELPRFVRMLEGGDG